MAPPLTPCRHNPDLWLDPTRRRPALQGCLVCPRRRWCAREALNQRASYGMWAGVWINHNLDDIAHYLRAIAAGPPPRPTPQAGGSRPAPDAHSQPSASVGSCSAAATPPPPSETEDTAGHPGNVAALITARASGHCELMTTECSYRLEVIINRRTGREDAAPINAATGYGVCRYCRSVLRDVDARLQLRLGYLVPTPTPCERAPFYWRQHRWAVFDQHGSSTEPITSPTGPPAAIQHQVHAMRA